jgi:hypothetical protein
MPRNNLKRLPVAVLRRGLAHFHPGFGSAGRSFATPEAGDGGQHVESSPEPPPPVAPALVPLVFEPDALGGPALDQPFELADMAEDLAA